MSQQGPNSTQESDSPAAAGTTQKRCWLCNKPPATGWTILGSARGPHSEGTKVPACLPGTGCRDGRIFHGPAAPPHHPGEECKICDAGRPRGRAVPRNSNPVAGTRRPSNHNPR